MRHNAPNMMHRVSPSPGLHIALRRKAHSTSMMIMHAIFRVDMSMDRLAWLI